MLYADLGQDMGLGKTLTALALIAQSVDGKGAEALGTSHASQNKERASTLVITTRASMSSTCHIVSHLKWNR